MAFSESLKLQVKKKAMFQCCRCHSTGIEVHHIIPQEKKGPDTFENAAPLCPNCHTWFGDNPKKKKEIREMRDNWYEVVEKMYSPVLIPEMKNINDKLDEVITKQGDISELKTMLKDLSNKVIDNMSLGTAQLTSSNLMSASAATLSNVRSQDISKMIWCRDCGEPLFITKPSDLQCYHCGYFNSGED